MASNKDVIYIDIEDDITSIIDKVKAAKKSIIALVPPKRTTVFQSVVNLKLLLKSSRDVKKKIVLITDEDILKSLAGGVGLHVAKTLNTKPAVPAAPKIDEDEGLSSDQKLEIDPKESIGKLDDKHKSGKPSDKKTDKSTSGDDSKKGFKVPNFEKFRMKIFLALGLVIILAIGWWFAFVKLPTAKVTITAQTSRVESNIQFTLDASVDEPDFEAGIIDAEAQELKKTLSLDFDATGEKNVGQKASGTVSVQNCDQSDPLTIPSGTGFSASGLDFISTKAVTVPGGSFDAGGCSAPGVADVTIKAASPGDNYNLGAGTGFAVAGQGSFVVATGEQLSGGTTEISKVVAKADVNKAKKTLLETDNEDVRFELKNLFSEDTTVLSESFVASSGDISSAPAVGQKADKGTVTVEFTFTQLGISKVRLDELLERNQEAKIDLSNQAIYDNGASDASYTLDKKTSNGEMQFSLRTNGFAGPQFDTNQLAEEISGKRFSEVVAIIKSKPGVNNVDVELSPFWVFNAPSADRTTINLEVSEHTLQ